MFDATQNGFDCPKPDCCSSQSHRCGNCRSLDEGEQDPGDQDNSPFSLLNVGLGFGGFFLTLLLCSPVVWLISKKLQRSQPAYITATAVASDDDSLLDPYNNDDDNDISNDA